MTPPQPGGSPGQHSPGTATPVNAMLQSYDGPSPVTEVALDMLKRGALVAPVAIMICAAIWGTDGAASVSYGMAIVLVNLWLSAAIIAWSAKISFAMVQAGALFGFLIRMGLIAVAVLVVRNLSWVNLVALGLTLIIGHLGLLFWELRYISASLAFPGLKPSKTSQSSASASAATSKETVLS